MIRFRLRVCLSLGWDWLQFHGVFTYLCIRELLLMQLPLSFTTSALPSQTCLFASSLMHRQCGGLSCALSVAHAAEVTCCSSMSANKRLVRFRWFGKIVPLWFLKLGSLRRRREDSITFLEIICHVRFVSRFLFFPICFCIVCGQGKYWDR